MGNTGQIDLTVQTAVVTLPRTSPLIWDRCGGSFKIKKVCIAVRPSAVVEALWQTICIQITFFLAFDGHFYEHGTISYTDIACKTLTDAGIQSCSHLHLPPVTADANQEAFFNPRIMCCKWKLSNTRPCSSSTAAWKSCGILMQERAEPWWCSLST